MEIQQSASLENLVEQFDKMQRDLQSRFGLEPLMLCVLQPDRPVASPEHFWQIVLLSPDWQRIMGWEIEAVKQQNWLELVHPDDRFETQAQLYLLLHQIQACTQFENRMRQANGSDRACFWQFKVGADGLLYGHAVFLPPDKPYRQPVNPLQQRLRRERLFTRISQRIRQTLDLNQVLQTTVAEVRDFLQSDRVAIFRFLPDWEGEVVVESVGSGCPSLMHQIIHDPCFQNLWHEAYLEGRVHQVVDIQQASLQPCYREMLTQLTVRANLVVPILQNNLQRDRQSPQSNDPCSRLWGLLLVHQCYMPRYWQQEDVSLLTQLAAQVAIAIQQSELYQRVNQLNATLEAQVKQRTAQLQQAIEFEATLKRITDKVRDSLDEAQILQTAIRDLALTLNVSSCDTGIYSRQQQLSTIVYEYICGDVPIAQNRNVPIELFPEYYQPLLQGEYLQFCWHNAIYVAGAPVRAIEKQFAVLACPIIDDQGVLGDLWLYKHGDAIYEEQEIRLVQQVANQCAIAIRQARLYQAAQQQVTELERLNYLKDDFLSTISHELRTPISNIKMAAELLEIHLHQMKLLGEGSPIDRPFEILKHETQREISLINDLLNLSRLDANTEPLLLTTIDLSLWLYHVTEPFIERARQQQQTLNLQIPPSLPLLTTDLTDLERIITELLENACKYSPSGETIALSACATPDQSALQICVQNSGVEIPAEEQTRIFDKFYRIPNSDPWRYAGVGLGLALIKKLIQRLGGTLRLESSDRTTAFTVTLPIGEPDSSTASKADRQTI